MKLRMSKLVSIVFAGAFVFSLGIEVNAKPRRKIPSQSAIRRQARLRPFQLTTSRARGFTTRAADTSTVLGKRRWAATLT